MYVCGLFGKVFMGKFDKVKNIWNTIKSEWKTRYRLVFSNEDTHEQNFAIRNITIQKMVIVAVIAAFVLILLTTLLIAFTPLRVYIPGYTTQKDYKLYKQTAERMDSLEKVVEYNQQYIDNFITMLNEQVPAANDEMDEDAEATPNVHTTLRDKKRMAEAEDILEEAEMILGRVSEDNNNGNVPVIDQAKISNLSIFPPTIGSVVRAFDASKNHYGIDIASAHNTVVTCIADGVVISAGYSATDGYVIIVQHPGNLISVYKRNAALLKKTGARVNSGDPIATMGNTGSLEGKSTHLHFELWYNGFPINPLDYLVIE